MSAKNSYYSVEEKSSSLVTSSSGSMTTTAAIKEEKSTKMSKRSVQIMIDETAERELSKMRAENEVKSNLTGMHSLFTNVFHTTSQESISEDGENGDGEGDDDQSNNQSDLDTATKLSKSDGNIPKRCVEEIYSSNHVSFVSSANLIADREFDASVRKMSKSLSGIEMITNETDGRDIKSMEINENEWK